MRPPLFQAGQSQFSQPFLIGEVFHPSNQLVTCLWICCNRWMSFLCCGFQSWMQSTRWGFHQSRGAVMSWLWLDIQIYKFSLTAISCPFTDGYYFPISRASSTPSYVQNQAMTWGRFHQDGCSGQEKQHTSLLDTSVGPVPPTLLTPHKIHPLSVHVIFAALLLQHTTYNTNYFLPKVKSPWITHRVSPSFCITHQLQPGIWAKTIP